MDEPIDYLATFMGVLPVIIVVVIVAAVWIVAAKRNRQADPQKQPKGIGMLRSILLIANSAWFAYCIFLASTKTSEDDAVLSLLAITLFLNALVIALMTERWKTSFLGLYLERIRLEQKRRVADLRTAETTASIQPTEPR